MKVERARPCPTHTHTHAHTHTRWWGPRGLPGQVAGPWEWSWTQSPLCAGAPTGLSAVTVTTTQTSLRGASSPSNQAQARWPCPGLQPPYPTGVQWKAWLCLHLSSSQWLLSPCPCSGPQPCGMGSVSQTAASPAWASGLEMGPLTAQGDCRANRSFQPWKVGPPC